MGLMNEITYKHISWDWNGTLFDGAWLCLETMNTLRRKRVSESLAASFDSQFHASLNQNEGINGVKH
jgi:hypothetical protein